MVSEMSTSRKIEPKTGSDAEKWLLDALQTGLDKLCAITIEDTLEPVQPTDKVFPATYLGDGGVATYGWEEIGSGDQKRRLFFLDSIPSQARRLSTALHQLTDPAVPRLLLVDAKDVPIIGTDRQQVSTLTANHRLYDMVFQSGKYAGSGLPASSASRAKDAAPAAHLTYFAESEFGRALLGANQADASLVFKYCPTILLFGGWNSRLSSWGTKFRRAVTSRIVALEQSQGRRTASRVDVLGIEHVGTVEYEKKAPHRWKLLTADETKAKVAAGIERKKLSEIGLGFIAPSVDPLGGIYPESVTHYFTLNVAELRHLRFGNPPVGTDEKSVGERITLSKRNGHAHSTLTVLGILAYLLQGEDGYNLRAGCLLRRKQSKVEIWLRGHSPDKDQLLEFMDLDALLKPLNTLYADLTKQEILQGLGLGWSHEFPKVQVGDELAKVLQIIGVPAIDVKAKSATPTKD